MAGATTALVGHGRCWAQPSLGTATPALWSASRAPAVGLGRRARPSAYARRSRYHLRQEIDLGSQFEQP